MGVKPFAAGNTLESLRDSDFDSCSAYGEVVDNSIQASATEIKIHFEEIGRGLIEHVIFMDDGDGMDLATIQSCLRLGWSSRYNDRSGIGRFGVGMTLGAIHECRRVEVYSKVASGNWLYTYLDLDEIEKADGLGEEWEIPDPKRTNPNEVVKDAFIPKVKGTIVVWSKYDRAQDKLQKIAKDFEVWLGRTYRYFIWGTAPAQTQPVKIVLNGRDIKAIDPLFLITQKTSFPDDPIATSFADINFEWPINDPKIVKALGKEKSLITIKLSRLPEEFRDYQGAGGSQLARDRHIDLNEGFSIMRRGREVGYDWIPHFKFTSLDVDRFWGCEISFDPELDRSFRVKNIKRGAEPSLELKKTIADKIVPWIRQQREAISDHWRAKSTKTAKGEDEDLGTHPLSEKIAGAADVPKGKADAGLDVTVEAAKVAELYSGGVPEEAAKLEARFKAQPYTIMEKAWMGPTFIDIHFMGGSDALLYNTRHIFFEVFNTIKGELRDGVNLEYNADRLVVLIDLMLVAYAKSEAMFFPSDKMAASDFSAFLKNNWGQFLKTYIQTWREEYDKEIQA